MHTAATQHAGYVAHAANDLNNGKRRLSTEWTMSYGFEETGVLSLAFGEMFCW